jgi:hypothetical protein
LAVVVWHQLPWPDTETVSEEMAERLTKAAEALPEQRREATLAPKG